MLFEPTDVVVRIALNTPDTDTAGAAMAACLPLVTELAPVAVEFEAADPAGLRRGFLAELLLVLPAAEAADPEQTLRASTLPLIRRLGMDPEGFTVDDESSGTSGDVHAPRDVWERGATACGAYSLYARLGADPFDIGDVDDVEGDEDDEDVEHDGL
ncbi:hypothetical protein ACWCXB_33440 [Streptomyces sp. NPDC001514]